MRADYINPFVLSTTNVFVTMVKCELMRGPLETKQSTAPAHEISGVIGMSGPAAGTVVVSLSREMALRAAGAMRGERLETINEEVVDAVGEITNLIAKGAKRRLAELSLSIGSPSVICGRNHSVSFPTETTPLTIPFQSSWGPVAIDVGLTEAAK